ncbi:MULTISPECIES: helix-turn-helix transcriptional regulator [Dermacoccus]|uniref:ArsR/SmtB family transcription factor n=1 Tax=Dermacoccus TaxID=57495 RepID=UPI0001E6423F|nr:MULTISPECIES: metalloregulator ArsR/SmtB family transcription factor [Dermacoccus]EFP58572.1 transcriptional regulator, ArsR family [Dermacoccus sp. Ellin185]MBO1758988.1 winged helix-turn-helix transcriptional regulator [Dermacoccus sp. NHGro5]
MSMRSEVADDPGLQPDLTAAVALFRSLADPTRLAIARRLASGEARVVDLTAELGLPQSTVSSHVACLRDCGLIDYRPQGRSSVYRVTHPELIELFAVAETLLGATGEAVALCPTYGDVARPGAEKVKR